MDSVFDFETESSGDVGLTILVHDECNDSRGRRVTFSAESALLGDKAGVIPLN